MTALANTFVINSDQTVATSAMARLKFVENSLHAISSKDEKILQGLKEATSLLEDYRRALARLIENDPARFDNPTATPVFILKTRIRGPEPPIQGAKLGHNG